MLIDRSTVSRKILLRSEERARIVIGAMLLTLQLLALLLVSLIVFSVAARIARATFRRRLDLGVVSQRWLLTHRAEE